jgi:voltage-gated potassium channel
MLPGRYFLMAGVLTALIIVGTLGYWLIEPAYSLFDAFYMTVITLTTVGYAEVHELSTAGRWFTIGLLLGGVFTFFFVATEILRSLISGDIQARIEKQRMARILAAMTNHLIVCGYGRMGRFVCHEFSRAGLPFVVIDRREELLREFDLPHGLGITGDATSDEILLRAGVERARALVTVLASDADNLFITMSARLLNDALYIVARAEGEQAEQKLTRAGANRVVAPYAIGGSKVAQAVLRPAVVDFIELATRTEHLELQIEEVQITTGSPLDGHTISSSQVRHNLGIIVVAILKSQGSMIYTPPASEPLHAGDTLIALGRREQMDQLEKLAKSGKQDSR